MAETEHPFAAIEETFKRSVAALHGAGVPFLLGGSIAIWAHGGPETRNDLDFMVRPEDAEQALQALVDAGMRPEQPPEDWLLKAWDGDVLVDLIHHPMGMTVTDEVIARGKELDVAAMRVRVMAVEDVLSSKLLALGEHALDLEPSLQLARALRERIDWGLVRARTESSPYARAFLHLVEDLGVASQGGAPASSHQKVRVVEPNGAGTEARSAR
ncbi:MAG TPA: nucleotidyltransferase [Solirubrobacterales bacterium]|nr:nucleotidyltransferase [Solirubrobacterales bacterium]